MGRCAVLVLLLALARPVAADDTDDDVVGMDAAVRGDWLAACQAFEKRKGDLRAALRLSAARAQANARLKEAIDSLTRERRWQHLAEAAACGALVDPSQSRYGAAARLATKEGAAEVAPTDPHVRPWATYGRDFGDARALADGCLDFLAKTQEADDHWPGAQVGQDAGVTALALLALTPDRPEPAGRAAKALLAMQQDDGTFGKPRGGKGIYGDALAVEALAEYAMAKGDVETFRDALRRGAASLVDAQSPGSGWGYEPRSGKCDTSITERVVAALSAARRADVPVDPEAFAGGRAWAEKMSEPNYGLFGYNIPGGLPSRTKQKVNAFPPDETQSMTAAGCIIYLFTGSDPLTLAKSFAAVFWKVPSARYPDMYYWDLGARACVAAHGQMPAEWYAALVKSAAACRADDGGMRACDAWGEEGGRIYATAITTIALMAPCRAAGKLSARPFLESGKCLVTVVGWAPLMPTGIYVDSGAALSVNASGSICAYTDGPEIGPEGLPAATRGTAQPLDPKAPFGCLLGRIDDGEPFALAIGKKNTMRGTGHLWLLVNETSPSDNYGWWDVTVERPK
ncbi:MAG TPA: prenyltransferase/squalene oxidase repeat-containing protein [Planctomycetota bacterium]|nr:prenyltransferase/squalene oxidase repeat-containing protein [Planctomycetota bacterium]